MPPQSHLSALVSQGETADKHFKTPLPMSHMKRHMKGPSLPNLRHDEENVPPVEGLLLVSSVVSSVTENSLAPDYCDHVLQSFQRSTSFDIPVSSGKASLKSLARKKKYNVASAQAKGLEEGDTDDKSMKKSLSQVQAASRPH